MKPLDPNLLLSLARLRGASLAEVREQDPQLYGVLSEAVGEQRRTAVTAAFGGASAALQARLNGLDLRPGDRPEVPLRLLVLQSVSGEGTPAAVLDEAARTIVALDRTNGLVDLAAPDVPLAQHPLLQAELRSVLATLSDREAGVIRLRFGLTDGRPRTLDEIGRTYGVTRERIRQIETKTMTKLRHPARSQVLRSYVE